MRRTVLILGTDHGFQSRDSTMTDVRHCEFATFLKQLVVRHSVLAIAEEYNEEALALAGSSLEKSVPQSVAHDLGLLHRYCDPDSQKRAELGIRTQNQIRFNALNDQSSGENIRELVDSSYRARESYWLEQLLVLDAWPTLFICGADHVHAFLALLRENGIERELVAADWGA